MPNEFTVVGEHRDDRTQLLVLGADGQYYRYLPAQDRFTQVEPDGAWLVFEDADAEPPRLGDPEGEPS
jgi:hypothetical protein